MFNPKISIIIPVYNGGNYLKEAIQSALDQTYNNIEVIVINDGSKDDGITEKTILSFGNKVKYFYKENGGVSSALNLGINNMTGEYFSRLSHDDLYFSEKLEKQVKFLEGLSDKCSVISSNYIMINKDGKILDRIQINYKSEELLYKLLMNSFINGCSLLIPKDIFDDVGMFNNDLKTTQDYHLWFRIMKKYNFINMSDFLIKSRQHAEQDSRTKIYTSIKERKALEQFVFKNFSVQEIKASAGSSLPNLMFILLLKLKLEKYRILGFIAYVSEKLGVYHIMNKLYRSLFN